MVLITDNVYGDILGYTRTDYNVIESNAYIVLTEANATANLSFAHEVGHAFGCRHQQCRIFNAFGCDNACGFNHGFAYGNFTDIMHMLRDGFTRRLLYSSPDVIDNGFAAGTFDNFNALQIDQQYGNVAGFRPTNRLTAAIDGPGNLSANGSDHAYGSWEAIYACGDGPYSIEWHWSYDGFNYYLEGDGETFSKNVACGATQYLRLIVRSSDGQVAESYSTVTPVNCAPPCPGCEPWRIAVDKSTGPEEPTGVVLGEAYPNPFQETTSITFTLPEKSSLQLEVLNAMGKPVRVLADATLPAGQHTKQLHSRSLPEGIYFYRLRTGNFSQSKKLVLIR